MPAHQTPKTSTTAPRRAVVAGASGLIGRELLPLLCADPETSEVHALVRRPLVGLDAGLDLRVQQHVIDYTSLAGALPACDDAYCCLGTTIDVAGSQAAFRAVDFDAALAFASAARAAGATRLAVVSALGASTASTVFYSRVKGEMEAAIATLGFDVVVIARPSLLAGDRAALGQKTRIGERVGLWLTAPFGALVPRSVRPIAAGRVAAAMLAALRQARPGVRIVLSGELQTLR